MVRTSSWPMRTGARKPRNRSSAIGDGLSYLNQPLAWIELFSSTKKYIAVSDRINPSLARRRM